MATSPDLRNPPSVWKLRKTLHSRVSFFPRPSETNLPSPGYLKAGFNGQWRLKGQATADTVDTPAPAPLNPPRMETMMG